MSLSLSTFPFSFILYEYYCRSKIRFWTKYTSSALLYLICTYSAFKYHVSCPLCILCDDFNLAMQSSLSWPLVPAEMNMEMTETGNLLKQFYHVCQRLTKYHEKMPGTFSGFGFISDCQVFPIDNFLHSLAHICVMLQANIMHGLLCSFLMTFVHHCSLLLIAG
jgi:hypothetical protein